MEQRNQIIAERKRLEKETRELLLIKQRVRVEIQGKIEMAKKHFAKKCLYNYGFKPLRKFVFNQKELQLDACIYHRRALLKGALGSMKRKIRDKDTARNVVANRFYQSRSMRS